MLGMEEDNVGKIIKIPKETAKTVYWCILQKEKGFLFSDIFNKTSKWNDITMINTNIFEKIIYFCGVKFQRKLLWWYTPDDFKVKYRISFYWEVFQKFISMHLIFSVGRFLFLNLVYDYEKLIQF